MSLLDHGPSLAQVPYRKDLRQSLLKEFDAGKDSIVMGGEAESQRRIRGSCGLCHVSHVDLH